MGWDTVKGLREGEEGGQIGTRSVRQRSLYAVKKLFRIRLEVLSSEDLPIE